MVLRKLVYCNKTWLCWKQWICLFTNLDKIYVLFIPLCLNSNHNNDNSTYKDSLNDSNNDNDSEMKRKREIMWFNPPHSKNIKTNVGKIFLNLVANHFPKHQMYRIIHKNTVETSYSCMRNISPVISLHNSILSAK